MSFASPLLGDYGWRQRQDMLAVLSRVVAGGIAERSVFPAPVFAFVSLFTRIRDQTALTPPSTARHCPVMWRDASLARNTTAPFKSSSPPMRCNGVLAITTSAIFSSKPADICDGKNPGQMALTLMLYLP